MHVKDFASREPGSFAPVGDGEVGYERVVPAAVEAGVEWLLVEQDETDGPPRGRPALVRGADRDGRERGRVNGLRALASSAAA